MLRLSLQATPNQEFSTQLDGFAYIIRIKTFGEITTVSVTIDGVLFISGMRIVAGQPLLPYLDGGGGNFFFTTETQELPFYTQFDVTHFLYYLSPTELENARA